jgi:Bifunctional DNA primase/polymerase, N-terminal
MSRYTGAGEPDENHLTGQQMPDTPASGAAAACSVPRDVLTDACVRHAAVEAVERGWFVFPTRPDGKEPRRGLSWPHAASGDLAQLARARWYPGENYGVAAKLSGLVMLDLDKPKPGYRMSARWRQEGWLDEPGITDGWDVLAALAERNDITGWPCTFTVLTPSGGAHLYYLAPAGRAIGNRPLGPMLDVRGGGDGDGGYVLGPGSVLGGRKYQIADDQDPVPLPGWIADLLDPPRREDQVVHRGEDHVGDRVAARLDDLITTVLDAVQGERNNALHWAACRAAEMVSAGQLTEEQVYDTLSHAAGCAGLSASEAYRTITSALRSRP